MERANGTAHHSQSLGSNASSALFRYSCRRKSVGFLLLFIFCFLFALQQDKRLADVLLSMHTPQIAVAITSGTDKNVTRGTSNKGHSTI